MIAGSKKPLAQRLAKYEIVTESGCWIWMGATDKDGYGCIGRSAFGKQYGHLKAHRVAYEFYIGEITDELHVLHTCDIPSCINPAHLYLGTPKQNSADKVLRGRCNSTPRFGKDNPMYGKTGSLNPFFGKHHTQESIDKANATKSANKQRQGSTTIASAMRGALRDKPEARAEFLSLMRK